MAVWADFSDDNEPSSPVPNQLTAPVAQGIQQADQDCEDEDVEENAPSAYVSHALRCYPIAEKLASYLDLTDLDSLSSTCRTVRESLIQFAHQLKQHSLRCTFEVEQKEKYDASEALALQLSFEDEMNLGGGNGPAFPVNIYPQQSSFQSAIGLSGKISRCARDLVAPCRNCGIAVCRNCTEKVPSSGRAMSGRLRRLCDECVQAPLLLHKAPLKALADVSPPTSSASSTRSARSDSNSSDDHDFDPTPSTKSLSELGEMWLRDPCTCATKGIYLCHSCGHNVRARDEIYQRVWKWRSRYSTHLGGGLGTGLGLGNQGQKCGRGKHCLATHDAMAIMEAECSSEDVSTPVYEGSRSHTPVGSDPDPEARPEPGYFRQEIEGVGGTLKSKSRKVVKVGATVYEFRDERQTKNCLGREARGELRSWCSWCERVCPGKQDRADMAASAA